MALSMEEQRILDEMEVRLTDDDPGLAARLASFGRPGLSAMWQSGRLRLPALLVAVGLVAIVALMAYSTIAVRTSVARQEAARHQPPPASRVTQASTARAVPSAHHSVAKEFGPPGRVAE
ncbi:MAG TPA: DUF3040 domain-containing protein [Streptosporangiaceae bacterium]